MRTQPLFVELIGPAGAGKSTLFRSLGRYDSVFPNPPFGVRQLRYLPYFLFFAALSLPVLLRQFANDRGYSWEETKKLVYLRGGRQFLPTPQTEPPSVVLLDQGPLFELARFREFGPAVLRPEQIPRWWDNTLDRWTDVLDLVIWLDAEDEVLLRRINRRDVWHQTKELSAGDALGLLQRYRGAYQELASQLRTRGQRTLIRIDTGQHSANETLDLAFRAIEEARSAATTARSK